MAKSVTDAAILLGALEGPDPNDPATTKCSRNADYTKFLEAGALQGARIGIPRAFFYDKLTPPGGKEPRGGVNADQAKAVYEGTRPLVADDVAGCILFGLTGGNLLSLPPLIAQVEFVKDDVMRVVALIVDLVVG